MILKDDFNSIDMGPQKILQIFNINQIIAAINGLILILSSPSLDLMVDFNLNSILIKGISFTNKPSPPSEFFPHLFHQLNTFFSRAYENNIIPGSSIKPYLILFYGDLCYPCFQSEIVWQKIVVELESLGVGFATIHSQHESALARKIGISSLPYIIGVVDGTVRHFKDDHLNLIKIIEFIRRILPKKVITVVDDTNYESFLGEWNDNRVRTLFINNDRLVRLRYLLTAFQFRERVACGHVSLGDNNVWNLIQKYSIDPKMDSLLIFNEDTSRPIATLTAPELKPQIMRDVLESNKFLLLPRLSSQVRF